MISIPIRLNGFVAGASYGRQEIMRVSFDCLQESQKQ